ncbi:ATP-grasp domain-containing protein [Streptomyces sp. NPDC002676]
MGEVVFAVNRSDFTEPLLPLLRELADVVLLSDEDEQAVSQLKQIRPDALLTFSERMQRRTATIAESLGLRYHSPDVADVLTNKFRQRQILRHQGVDAVACVPLTAAHEWPEAVAAVGLPAVLKPTRGEGSRETHLVEGAAHGQALVRRLLSETEVATGEPPFVLEELLQGQPCAPYGDYVSVESAVLDGNVRHLAVTSTLPLVAPFREVGGFWPCVLPPQEQQAITDLTQRALTALGVRVGITHTEVKLTPDGPRIIEVNGRLGGLRNELSLRATGIDLVHVAGQLALGEPVTCEIPAIDGVHFYHLTPAPLSQATVTEFQGVAQVRQMRHVATYRPTVRPGAVVGGGVGSAHLDIMWGQAPDHDAMLTTVEQALNAVEFTFTFPSGPVRMTARSLLGADRAERH